MSADTAPALSDTDACVAELDGANTFEDVRNAQAYAFHHFIVAFRYLRYLRDLEPLRAEAAAIDAAYQRARDRIYGPRTVAPALGEDGAP